MATKWIQKWNVNSRTSGNTYTVSRDADNNFGCSCPAWKFQRKQCAHIEEIKETQWPQEQCDKILDLTEILFKALGEVANVKLNEYLSILPTSHKKQLNAHIAQAKKENKQSGWTHYSRFAIDYHNLTGMRWVASKSPDFFLSLNLDYDNPAKNAELLVKQPSSRWTANPKDLLVTLQKTIRAILPNIGQILDFYMKNHIALLCVTSKPFSMHVPEEMKAAWAASSLTQVYGGLVGMLTNQFDPANQLPEDLSAEECVEALRERFTNEFGDLFQSAYMAAYIEKSASLSSMTPANTF